MRDEKPIASLDQHAAPQVEREPADLALVASKPAGAAPEPAGVCKWNKDSDGNYFTDCNNSFSFIDAGPTENGMKFCCYCGHELKDIRYEERD